MELWKNKNGIRLYRDNFGHISLNGAKQYIGPELRSFLIQRKLIKKNPEIFESKESSSIQKIKHFSSNK